MKSRKKANGALVVVSLLFIIVFSLTLMFGQGSATSAGSTISSSSDSVTWTK